MPRVVHFEINADRPERAIEFYLKVFGWKIAKWEGPMEYWNITTGESGPGIDGGLMRRQDPADKVIDTIEVPSLDEYMQKVDANGGKVVTPKMTIPGVGHIAYFNDTEGNSFGLMQSDESAR